MHITKTLHYIIQNCWFYALHYLTAKQTNMKFNIKFMKTASCRQVVRNILSRLGFRPVTINRSEVEVKGTLTREQISSFRSQLIKMDLDLITDDKEILVENIKDIIIEMLLHPSDMQQVKNSAYISKRAHYDYNYLSNIFSKVTGVTLEQYIITSKVDRIKELIKYKELNLTEISYYLNYSSVSHLSKQFKQVTGISPSYYKRMDVLTNAG